MKRIFQLKISLILLCPLILATARADNQITPSHVFQVTEKIIAEVELLRESEGIDSIAREPDVQADKKPLHAYAKSLEVLKKIARFQDRKGLEVVDVGEIPLSSISSGNVYESATKILSEIHQIKEQLGISAQTDEPAFVVNKTASNVYQNFWRASYLMDSLAGQVSPTEVYQGAQKLLSEVKLILTSLSGDFSKIEEDVAFSNTLDISKTTKDVNIEAFKNLYRIVSVQQKYGMEFTHPSRFPAGDIHPSDVLEATNLALAEITRIKSKLNITEYPGQVVVMDEKTIPHALPVMQMIGATLVALLELS